MFGFLSGLGAATADAVYGCIAGFGLTAITGFLIGYRGWLQLIGGLFLCYLGIQTFKSRPAQNSAVAKGEGILSMYTSTFFLTITNPMTILSFLGIFSGIGLRDLGSDYISSILLVFGVFTGSTFWWILLSYGTGFLRHKLNTERLVWINRFSGIIITCFGVSSLYTLTF